MTHILSGLFGGRRQRSSNVRGMVMGTYDSFVASFDPDVVSYWKFENSGTDEYGTQNATITGNPELNIETIVDFDSVAAGAEVDGKCIAWPGTIGEYAEAPHNAAHKTALGTIVVTFQCDTLSEKSVLVASGANGVAGELSLEINTDGSPTAYLRNANGVPVRLTGDLGDVNLNQAYTLVFKWGGSDGLSLALWDETHLIRRRKNTVSDGAGSTSPIRFGAWHTDIAHHDGPYGRVIWLNRRITDQEEGILARARTIVHDPGVEEPPPAEDDLSPDPPAGANVWVAPGGTASWPGTQANPMGSVAAAIQGSSAGDIIAFTHHPTRAWDLDGAGTISGKNGTAANPIRVIGYGTRRPNVDNSVKAFRNGTVGSPTGQWSQIDAGKNIWQSNSTFSNPSSPVIGYGPIGDGNPAGTNSRLMLLPYGPQTCFEATGTTAQNDSYAGPGLHFSGGRVRIRTETARFSSELGHGSFPTNKNPNQQDIVVCDLPDRTIWTFENCSHIHIKNVDLLYANRCVVLNNSTNMTFERCHMEGHEDYFSLGSGSNNCKLLHCQFHFNIPNYMAWRDFKKSAEHFPSFNGRGMVKSPSGGVQNLRVENCEFFGCHIPVWAAASGNSGWKILNCEFRRLRDDGIDHDTRTTNMEIAYNWVHDRSQWFLGWSGSTTVSPNPGATIYVHHNLVDCSTPYFYQRHGSGNASTTPAVGTAMSGERMWVGHSGGNPAANMLLRVYHNTFITCWSDPVDAKGIGITPNRGYPSQSGGAAHDLFNNIFVQTGDRPGEGFFAVWRHNRIDGNCWYRPGSPSTSLFTEVYRDGSANSNYSSLANAKADTAMVNASKTMWSPGFENSGIQANPQFVGGSPTGPHDFSTRSASRPTNNSAKTGAINLVGMGHPGPQNTTYQAWRGALDPNGDGGEVGVQP